VRLPREVVCELVWVCVCRELVPEFSQLCVPNHTHRASMAAELSSAPLGRKIIAMQYGDHCWLKGLSSNPELNDRQVRLELWINDKERWKCTPVGWKYPPKFLAVKPRNLSDEPPESPSRTSCDASSSEDGGKLAALLEMLLKRASELRADSIRLFNAKDTSDVSLESCVRLGLCQVDLMEVQLQILSKGGTKEQVKQCKAKLSMVRAETAAQLKKWKVSGYPVPDYWETPTLVEEALLARDVDRYRGALGPRPSA